MIWLRRANTPDLSRGLTDHLAVVTKHLDLTFSDPLQKKYRPAAEISRDVNNQQKEQIFPLQLSSVTDTFHLQNGLKTRADAAHHVRKNSRVVPCKARSLGSSDLRVMTMLPSSNAIPISEENVRFNSPFGPFTWTSEPCTLICTPFGTATGKRPIRDT